MGVIFVFSLVLTAAIVASSFQLTSTTSVQENMLLERKGRGVGGSGTHHGAHKSSTHHAVVSIAIDQKKVYFIFSTRGVNVAPKGMQS